MTRLEVALPILQGLLASGHYTRPEFHSCDTHKPPGYISGNEDTCEAVDDAFRIADEMILRGLVPGQTSQNDEPPVVVIPTVEQEKMAEQAVKKLEGGHCD